MLDCTLRFVALCRVADTSEEVEFDETDDDQTQEEADEEEVPQAASPLALGNSQQRPRTVDELYAWLEVVHTKHPPGCVVGSVVQGSEEWDLCRLMVVTGTRAKAVLAGYKRYLAYEKQRNEAFRPKPSKRPAQPIPPPPPEKIFYKKTLLCAVHGMASRVMTSAMRNGLKFEEEMLDWATDQIGCELIRHRFVRHDRFKWACSSPDGVGTLLGGTRIVVEVKCIESVITKISKSLCDKYDAQIQFNLFVLEARMGYLVVRDGNGSNFFEAVPRRNDAYFERLIAAGEHFFQEHLSWFYEESVNVVNAKEQLRRIFDTMTAKRRKKAAEVTK